MFRDEYEVLTGVPVGHDAFWILSQPRRESKEPAEKAAGKPYMTATQKAKNALRSDEERAADRKAKRGTRPTRSKAAQAAHEKQVAAKRAAKLARKNRACYFVEQGDKDRSELIKK